MVTGVECVGLVLAVLPLVIEGAKVYHDGVESIKDVVVAGRHDEALQEFYEVFLFEVTLLHDQLRQAVAQLQGVSEKRKEELLRDFREQDWEPKDEVAVALQTFYGTTYDLFIIVTNKIMGLMGHLVRDKAAKMNAADKVCKTVVVFLCPPTTPGLPRQSDQDQGPIGSI